MNTENQVNEQAVVPAAPEAIPYYVKLLEKKPMGSWHSYEYQFANYGYDFMLKCIQTVINGAQRVGNATIVTEIGKPEDEHTRELLAAGCQIAQCPPFQTEQTGIALGCMTRELVVKVFLFNQSNRITVMVYGDEPESVVTAYLNEVLHKTLTAKE